VGDGRAAPARRLTTSPELFVADLDRSIAFYARFGLTVARRWEDWARLVHPAGAGIVLQGDAHAVAGPHYFTPHIGRVPRGTGVEITIEVPEVDDLHALAVREGLGVVKGLVDRPWGARDFRVADPDGYFVRFTTPLRDR